MVSNLEPVLVPLEEGAKLLGVKRSKFYALAKEGHFRILKIGRKSVVEVAAMRAFANSIALAA
jgi:excisionase family DNA binding protein